MIEAKEKLVYTVKEAAEVLGVGANTMYELIHRADFPKVPVGARWKIPKQALSDWLMQQAGLHSGEGAQ